MANQPCFIPPVASEEPNLHLHQKLDGFFLSPTKKTFQ